MGQKRTKWSAFRAEGNPNEALESHYDQLLHWGTLLTRGEAGAAREIVHDLCLYLILTKADFSRVANLDGYLYTALRHVYLSHVSLASREALRFVSTAEFDCVQFALAAKDRGGSVTIQNELRIICAYSGWRKETSKSFSFFVLHFFHGYFPREIAEIAKLPVSAIYNKLKSARTDLKAHLSAPEKIQSIKRGAIPVGRQSQITVTTTELFRELRETILQTRKGECLPEESLVELYSMDVTSPTPCELLSHIVSCERCLKVVDHHFGRPTLQDRDVLDGFDRGLNMQDLAQERTDRASVTALFETMRRQKQRIYHHRPQTLFITVNARVVAFHDVQGVRSTLSVLLDYSGQPNFVEVFSEQRIRLAMIAIDDLPPAGPSRLAHRTLLSDRRTLELSLSFDGLGLHGEVLYLDPDASAVPQDATDDAPAVPPSPVDDRPASWIRRLISAFVPSPAMGWSLALALAFGAAGYFAHQASRPQIDASAVLNRAIEVQAIRMAGYTKHQTLELQETTSDGHVLTGVVETWQEGESGRYTRRLFDSNHHALASEWKDGSGKTGTFIESSGSGPEDPARQLATNDLWKQDLSSRGFRALAGKAPQVSTNKDGYTLTAKLNAGAEPHLQSVALVLDGQLNAVKEEIRLSSGSKIRLVRLVQNMQRYEPASEVPNDVFSREALEGSQSSYGPERFERDHARSENTLDLIQLEIAVLYELDRMGADIGDPIKVERTSGGRIGVYGTVSDDTRKALLTSRLATLPSQQLLTIQLKTHDASHKVVPYSSKIMVTSNDTYSVTRAEAPAESVVRQYFEAKGITGERERVAVSQFSQEALKRSQLALQHAYALDRLGRSFTPDELRSAEPAFQRQWAAMVSHHALGLQEELRALREQLGSVFTINDALPAPLNGSVVSIEDPAEFSIAAGRLLQRTQELNYTIGGAFASGVGQSVQQDDTQVLPHAIAAIPLQGAGAIVDFARRLSNLDLPNARPRGAMRPLLRGER